MLLAEALEMQADLGWKLAWAERCRIVLLNQFEFWAAEDLHIFADETNSCMVDS